MNWQLYAQKNLNHKRGYVYDDDIANFYKNGVRLLNSLWSECCNPTNKSIVDLGCGTGRLPIAIDGEGIEIDFYTGIDIVTESIRFCKQAFKTNPKFSFHHIPVRNSRYAPRQNLALEDTKLPSIQHDILIANSVFTHIGVIENADLYLGKIKNLVKDDGLLYISWFRNPPQPLNDGTKRTCYRQDDIIKLYKKHNLEIIRTFGGVTTTSVDDQWRIVAQKR